MFGRTPKWLKIEQLEAELKSKEIAEVAEKRRAHSEQLRANKEEKEALLEKQKEDFDRFYGVGESFTYLGQEFVVTENNSDHIVCHYYNSHNGEITQFSFGHYMIKVLEIQET